MTTDMHNFFDILLKAVGGLGALIGSAWALWKYLDSGAREYRKPYWERQIDLYFQATQAAATLSTASAPDKSAKALEVFWQLYWGPLALVEDRDVEDAMVAFGKALQRAAPETDRQACSLRLAHACRRSLGSAWRVRLDALPGRDPMPSATSSPPSDDGRQPAPAPV